MASRFETDFAASAWAVLASVHGRTLTYTPDGGVGATVTGIWEPREVAPSSSPDGGQARSAGVVQLAGSDAPDPTDRDSVTIDAVVYAVLRVVRRGPVVELEVESREELRVGGDASRIKR